MSSASHASEAEWRLRTEFKIGIEAALLAQRAGCMGIDLTAAKVRN
jgi:hypothetical protein